MVMPAQGKSPLKPRKATKSTTAKILEQHADVALTIQPSPIVEITDLVLDAEKVTEAQDQADYILHEVFGKSKGTQTDSNEEAKTQAKAKAQAQKAKTARLKAKAKAKAKIEKLAKLAKVTETHASNAQTEEAQKALELIQGLQTEAYGMFNRIQNMDSLDSINQSLNELDKMVSWGEEARAKAHSQALEQVQVKADAKALEQAQKLEAQKAKDLEALEKAQVEIANKYGDTKKGTASEYDSNGNEIIQLNMPTSHAEMFNAIIEKLTLEQQDKQWTQVPAKIKTNTQGKEILAKLVGQGYIEGDYTKGYIFTDKGFTLFNLTFDVVVNNWKQLNK